MLQFPWFQGIKYIEAYFLKMGVVFKVLPLIIGKLGVLLESFDMVEIQSMSNSMHELLSVNYLRL